MQVLVDSGVGKVLSDMMAGLAMPPDVLAFVIAALVRIAQGSATVAMITAAGLVAPLVQARGLQGPALYRRAGAPIPGPRGVPAGVRR